MFDVTDENPSFPGEFDHIDPEDNFLNTLFPCLEIHDQSDYCSAEKYNNVMNHGYHSLNVINYNIRSYNSNAEIFFALCNSLSVTPNVIVLTETWFNDDNIQCPLNYRGFHTVRDGRSGGVSVMVADCFTSFKIDKLSPVSYTHLTLPTNREV